MKNTKIIFFLGIVITSALLSSSCSTRGVHVKYFGATEQRLITQSIDSLVKMLPEKDFVPLKGQAIYLECYFIEDNTSLKYAKKRLELELMEKYKATLISDSKSADKIIHVFLTPLEPIRTFLDSKLLILLFQAQPAALA